MDKIQVLTCTNRPNSYSHKVSKIYLSLLKKSGIEASYYNLESLPENIAFSDLYGKRSRDFEHVIEQVIRPYKRFIFVVPEYNGSFPGILKVFLDAVHPREWNGKKACLVGVSSGRAGNLRGMEHLTGVLLYLKMNVYHNRLPISGIEHIVNEENEFKNPEQLLVCEHQIRGFLEF